MNTLRVPLLCLLLAGVFASAAHATIRREPVKVRLAGPAPVVQPGDRVPLQFELVAARPVTVSRIEVASRALARPFAMAPAPLRVEPGRAVPLALDVTFVDDMEPLVVTCEVDGEPVETTIDLSLLLASKRAARAAMVQVSDQSVNPAGPSAAGRSQIGHVPSSEGDPEITPLSRVESPLGAQQTIQVTGRLVYYRDDGVMIGADRMWVRVMDEDYGPDDELASSYTDDQGYFTINFNWGGQLGDSDPDIYVKFETESDIVTVQSTGLEIEYSWNTPTRANFTGTAIHLGTWAPADQSTHGALHIYTNITHDYFWYIAFETLAMPPLDVQWPESGTGAWYDSFWEEIHISSERTWWDDTHAHEYGHHFMNNFASSPSPEYCNGYCDGDDCGHCMWCEETASVAVTEGFPNYIAHVQTKTYKGLYGVAANRLRDQESVARCGETSTYHDPTLTEGFFGALLQDIWDHDNETDPGGFGLPDALFLEHQEIFDVMRMDKPTSVMAFMNAFRSRFPQHTVQLWQTAYNNRLNVDTGNPSPVTGLTSPDHTVGVPSPDATITTTWNASTDDWSGVVSYDYVIDRPDPLPDTTFSIPGTIAVTYHLPPGQYAIKVRARDRSGRVSAYATIGPFDITQPTPADLAYTTPAGWTRPVVPRAAADAFPSLVLDPPTLTGNTASTYFNYAYRNAGQQAPLWGADSWLLLDGGLFGSKFTVTPAPGAVGTVVNRGPFTIPGGRHHVGEWLDVTDQWWESNEANNVWGRPWVWSPVAFTGGPGNNIRRSAPPGPTDGWWSVKDGSPLYYTCDGIRWGATTSMNLVWMAADQDTSDFDVRLHFPSTGPQSGFDVIRGTSARGPGCLEVLMVNRYVWGGDLNWDIGVTNANGGGETYLIARRVPSTLTVDAGAWAYTLPDSEYAQLFGMYVASNDGPVTVTAQGDPAQGPFYLAYFGTTFGYGGLSDPSVTIYPADSTGLARIQVVPTGNGNHGVLLFRDPKDGRESRVIDIRADRTPGDLVATTAAGWHSPLVPRPTYDGPGVVATLPDTLYGESNSNYFNISGTNASIAGIAGAFTARIEVDELPVIDYIPTSATPGQVFASNLPLGVPVDAGRHTLTVHWDYNDLWPELYETNNVWGEQYVWGPQTHALGVPVFRSQPFHRTAGWDRVTSGEPLYYNVNGTRTPTFAGWSTTWGGMAIMPGGTSDSDLQLHELAAGVKDGFTTPLVTSSWGVGESDYVLVCFDHTPKRAFDVGVANPGAGTEPYALHLTAAGNQVLIPGVPTGPYAVGANEVVRLTQIFMPPGTFTVRLLPVSGTVDLGLSVHAPDRAYHSKSDPVESSWLNPGGGIEEVTFDVPSGGYYCFAVWKVAGELPSVAEYQLEIVEVLVDVAAGGVPGSTQLAPAAPSPFARQTAIAFDLARGGPVELEVFDVSGARVRTLASGSWQPGRHRLTWDGRDQSGHRLGAGVYFVRLAAEGKVWGRKVIKLDQ